MIGKYHLKIKNSKIAYEFDLNRKVTIIRGDSATGKTTLLNMVSRYNQSPNSSPIEFNVNPKCDTVVLTNQLWRFKKDYENYIIFIDEHFDYTNDKEFNKFVNTSNNYFVIVDRDDTGRVDYSITDIYRMKNSGKYSNIQPLYTNYLKIKDKNSVDIDKLLVEDSNAGFDFYEKAYNKPVVSSKGNSKIIRYVNESTTEKLFIAADGAAFGRYITELDIIMKRKPDINLFLPESFEYLLLCAGILDLCNRPNVKFYDGINVDSI